MVACKLSCIEPTWMFFFVIKMFRFLANKIWIFNRNSFVRSFASKKYDPQLIEQLTQKIENEQTFVDFQITDFEHFYADDCYKKDKVNKIVHIYDNMKYNLEQVPSTLTLDHLKILLQFEQISDIKRYLRKFYRKEIDSLVKKQLKTIKTKKTCMDPELNEPFDRTGIFDRMGNLKYGLWHNTLVTRIPKTNRTRFNIDRLRQTELFGQNLYIDFSFSKHLNHHMSIVVANDLARMLNFNRHSIKEPFKLTLCGVDYDHQLWRTLCDINSNILEITSHTSRSYFDLCKKKSQLIYVTCMENHEFLEYDPNAHYVMAALSEKDLHQDFFTPALRRLPIKRKGIPIDQHVIWNNGSKRLTLHTRLKLISDIRNNVSWKEALMNNIYQERIKTEEQILQEDYKRFLKNKVHKR